MSETENRLLSVVEHWLPRIEVAGIPSATAKAVIERAGTWDNWLAAWSEEGERHAAIAAEALGRGHRTTAGEAYHRASLFYHFGQFMAFHDLAAKEAAARRKVDLFRTAAPLLDRPAEAVEAPFEDGILRGYLRLPSGQGPHPLVLIIPGSDSTKEEFPAFELHFLLRGIATLSFDGPGQGEGRAHGPLRPDIAGAIAAVIEKIRPHKALSGARALTGMAFGGFLALHAANMIEDLTAVVSINGFYDLGGFWSRLPRVYVDNMSFALGENAVEKAKGFTLAGCPQTDLPALILHGARDKIFPPAEAELCAKLFRKAELHIFAEGNHVCNNIPWLYRPLIADWLADRFKERVTP
jgi:dienelactone hydrolase